MTDEMKTAVTYLKNNLKPSDQHLVRVITQEILILESPWTELKGVRINGTTGNIR
jgi:hypothetical protein